MRDGKSQWRATGRTPVTRIVIAVGYHSPPIVPQRLASFPQPEKSTLECQLLDCSLNRTVVESTGQSAHEVFHVHLSQISESKEVVR